MAPDICLLKVGKWVLAIARTPVDKVIIGNANLFKACKIVQVLLSCFLLVWISCVWLKIMSLR